MQPADGQQGRTTPYYGLLIVFFFLVCLPVPESIEEVPTWRAKKGETAFVSEGDLFQVEGCPYTLSSEQAEQLINDESEVGNTITLLYHGGGEENNASCTFPGIISPRLSFENKLSQNRPCPVRFVC